MLLSCSNYHCLCFYWIYEHIRIGIVIVPVQVYKGLQGNLSCGVQYDIEQTVDYHLNSFMVSIAPQQQQIAAVSSPVAAFEREAGKRADRQPVVFTSWLVECCFTSTETVGLLGTGSQDGHLDFHTAPEVCSPLYPAVLCPLSGLDVYRTCKLPTKAARGVVALLNKYGVGQEGGKTSGSLFGE